MKTLEEYRAEIDLLDDQIVALLGKRFEIVKKVGKYKTQNKLDIVQHKRVEIVRERARKLALKNSLDPDFVVSLYDTMIDHAHKLESQIKAEHDQP